MIPGGPQSLQNTQGAMSGFQGFRLQRLQVKSQVLILPEGNQTRPLDAIGGSYKSRLFMRESYLYFRHFPLHQLQDGGSLVGPLPMAQRVCLQGGMASSDGMESWTRRWR